MKRYFANCRQDLIVQKQAWEAFIVKPTAGVHSVGTIFMTKILPNEQTLQLSSDGANKIKMHAIRGNISGFHLITEAQSQVQTPDLAE